jgi:outer membrane protein OmpA-like peptidoglycan-associated protein
MRKSQQPTLSAVLLAAIGAATAGAVLIDGVGLVPSAQAQAAEEKEKKKERDQQERQRPPPPRPQTQPGGTPPPPRVTQPPPARMQQERQPREPSGRPFQDKPYSKEQPPPGAKPYPQPKPADASPPELRKKEGFQPSPGAKPYPQPKPVDASPPELRRKEGFQPAPGQPGVQPPPATLQNVPPSGPGPARPLTVTPGPQPGQPGPQGLAPKRFEDMKKFRVERIEKGGDRKVIQEPDRRFIVKEYNRTIVRHDESERFLRRPGARSERRPDGTVETFYIGRNGVRIVTVVNADGRLLRRYRVGRDGRERDIIDNRRFYRNVGIGVGIGALGIIALNLALPRVTIPQDEYIVDYDRASDDDLYETLMAPPIEALDRPYSLEEIRDNYELRARVRSIDIDSVYFDTGAWEVSPDQYDKLERIARAILRVLESKPEAVFLIAGHTDAVGSDDDNASLSDRRAAAVAEVLTDRFDVPAENLVTQGYGEQYLKVETQGPEPRNRRVSIQNITGLMAER